jgi:membrane protein insertase Oxa1/YidC/SpoIIIJ
MLPDPIFALPILAASLTMANIHTIQSQMKPVDSSVPDPTSDFKKYMKFIPVLALPITITFPVAFNLYMCMIASW